MNRIIIKKKLYSNSSLIGKFVLPYKFGFWENSICTKAVVFLILTRCLQQRFLDNFRHFQHEFHHNFHIVVCMSRQRPLCLLLHTTNLLEWIKTIVLALEFTLSRFSLICFSVPAGHTFEYCALRYDWCSFIVHLLSFVCFAGVYRRLLP